MGTENPHFPRAKKIASWTAKVALPGGTFWRNEYSETDRLIAGGLGMGGQLFGIIEGGFIGAVSPTKCMTIGLIGKAVELTIFTKDKLEERRLLK